MPYLFNDGEEALHVSELEIGRGGWTVAHAARLDTDGLLWIGAPYLLFKEQSPSHPLFVYRTEDGHYWADIAEVKDYNWKPRRKIFQEYPVRFIE